jgi:hypothetical protein
MNRGVYHLGEERKTDWVCSRLSNSPTGTIHILGPYNDAVKILTESRITNIDNRLGDLIPQSFRNLDETRFNKLKEYLKHGGP